MLSVPLTQVAENERRLREEVAEAEKRAWVCRAKHVVIIS